MQSKTTPSRPQSCCPIKSVAELFFEPLTSSSVGVAVVVCTIQHGQLAHAGDCVLNEVPRKLVRIFDDVRIATAKGEICMHVREALWHLVPHAALGLGYDDLLVLHLKFVLYLVQRLFPEGAHLIQQTQIHGVRDDAGVSSGSKQGLVSRHLRHHGLREDHRARRVLGLEESDQ
eukprot:CAMPEP_0183511010 /NCGR_PEP_ID=MMETSP0371-20130417/10639_1 /TAXON_ID=268820 /ORGANISM="Peridinium aciculiferum, Strain PAER-2" /LENGTH=173 /DNA_ID=CAMNT_0025707883 /DNA_START=244 /DNA_END=762 /DNA_ORIENTATION=+